MKKLTNKQLTKNFWLHEFIAGTEVPPKGHEMAWEAIIHKQQHEPEELQRILKNIDRLAKEMQSLRNAVNKEFQERNGGVEIGIVLTSAYRPVKWELFRNRSGNGQHPNGWAGDLRVVNVADDALYNEIMLWIYTRYSENNWNGGLAYLKSKNPIFKNRPYRFVHIDFRGWAVRWKY